MRTFTIEIPEEAYEAALTIPLEKRRQVITEAIFATARNEPSESETSEKDLASIGRGIADYEAGRVVNGDEFFAQLRKERDSRKSEPFQLVLTQEARATITNALLFLDTVGQDAADRFTERLEAELTELRQEIAEQIGEGDRPNALPDEEASLRWSQPVYKHRFQTGKTRSRRSSAGLWFVYYALKDKEQSGKPDTLVVYSVRHSAARPFSIEADDQEDGKENE